MKKIKEYTEENQRIYYSLIDGIGVTEVSLPLNDNLRHKIFTFVDTEKDPFHYIDRYENEPQYKEWFDENYPKYAIFDAVGISEEEYIEYIAPEPESICDTGTELVDGTCQ